MLNLGFLTFGSILMMTISDSMARLHRKMYGVSEADLSRIYFQWLAQYKTATFVLNLAPYVALKIMA